MKKLLIFLLLLSSTILPQKTSPSNALEQINESLVYIIYDEQNNYLFERQNVIVGDEYISRDLNQYIVYEVNSKTQTGKAKFVKSLKAPKIKKTPSPIKSFSKPKIGLYMTHNDESYITGDGYDSIYGKGGIHDIANQLKNCLEENGNEVFLNETLHIPHDTKAYLRSEKTAISLIENYSVDFLYDIHRDGASRKTYVTKVGNEDFCKVRIVVGKANTNFDDVKNYALYMVSISELIHPMLFLDIYLANGNYNQYLTNNSLLFEMGSHLVEKNLVIKTIPKLAEVITETNKKLLYGDFEEEEENIQTSSPILPPQSTETPPESTPNFNINNQLNNNQNTSINNEKTIKKLNSTYFLIPSLAIIFMLFFIVFKKKNSA